ncbi:MAG: deoxyribodipyrimidine photolyase [Myxococcales bacterium]|nr:deoxyribodipyrimidine photolyase [Myxococcales bacterium]
MAVPEVRIRTLTDAPLRDGDHVLYWMTAFRRPHHNFALDRAIELCRETDRPLLVLEALRVGYRWASDRFHRFVLDGMRDHRAVFTEAGVAYHPYVEPEPGHGSGLLRALAERAVAVVTDDYPAFFHPRMLERAAELLEEDDVLLEAVDGNGLYPMRATERIFSRAVDFRRHLHKELLPHLEVRPSADPFAALAQPTAAIPDAIRERWPAASPALLDGGAAELAAFPIDHGVPVALEEGGHRAGEARMERFLAERLEAYGEGRNHPDDDVASGLSPYLHFGHVSIHDLFARLEELEGWSPAKTNPKRLAKREGWWGMSAGAEAFLDEAITWRELGFNMCGHRLDYDRFETLPDWAKKTLAEHEGDTRPVLYDLATFEAAETHDDIWNAAQRQLVATGRMHNYLRMLWGKKILHWTKTPREALEIMVELNNKYALDGRDPNSYSGIFCVLGRYDRAWGPEREVFGKIRYMTSDSTRKKLRLSRYLERFATMESAAAGAPEPAQRALFD